VAYFKGQPVQRVNAFTVITLVADDERL